MESPVADQSQFQLLQDRLTPDILGVFWATQESLIEKPTPFAALDYFLDGLLTSFHHQKMDPSYRVSEVHKKNYGKNFFITESFGEPFFVGHISVSSEKLNDNIHDLITMAKSIAPEKKSILVVDNSTKKILAYLRKKYPTFKFTSLNL